MSATLTPSESAVRDLAAELARGGEPEPRRAVVSSHPAWAALRATGTRLWLDTGDLDEAAELWTTDFSNLTTNNTLVNREVQKGHLDAALTEAGRRLRATGIDEQRLVWEVGFVANCRVALRLVQAFDATVSVELHPAMADDVPLSVDYGRRYYAVCPDRFIVKVPLTPAGLLVARQLSGDGIPVNFTLGFSARQNVLAAAFSRPAFANVFMGRLNSFVADSGLGSGENIGEKTTMATQLALHAGRTHQGWVTHLIGASMRSGAQVWALAGLDVFTMPVSAAREFQSEWDASPRALESQIGREFPIETTEPEILARLWTVDDPTRQAATALAREATPDWRGEDLVRALGAHGAADLFRAWSGGEREEIRSHGKIPRWERWSEDLRGGRIALDDLMTISALESFVKDQAALDDRIRRLIGAG